MDWLKCSVALGCEIVPAPSDTNNVLQSCGQDKNKTFKSSVRWIRDFLSAQSSIDVSYVCVALINFVIGYQSAAQRISRASFMKYGLWPMDYWFLDHFCSENDKTKKLYDQTASALVNNSDHPDRVSDEIFGNNC